MKLKKILVLPLILFIVALIYILNTDQKLNYVALGDSLVEGLNPYDQIGYSYSDYVKDYLKNNNLLKFYTKEFAKSGYSSKDLLLDLKNNKSITIGNQTYNIKRALRDSDLVTISIGANDIRQYLNLDNRIDSLEEVLDVYNLINKVFDDIEEVLTEIERYAKGDILIVGYYNPFPTQSLISQEYVDEVFSYVDKKYEDFTDDDHIYYLSIYSMMKSHPEYLPNPHNVHPNIQGYEAISKEIIRFLEKNILN